MEHHTQEYVTQVKDAVVMLDLVGRVIKLHRAPVDYESYVGICPFCGEECFMIQCEYKLYYCFGCEAKGDAIEFVKRTEGLSFHFAVELLAARYDFKLWTQVE